MNTSTKEIGQTEQEPNNEQTADNSQVSPSIANALVGSSYPKEVQDQIDVLSTYEEVQELDTCNLLHLYDTGVTCADNDGYVDSRYFELWAFNFDKQQKINLGRHDGCSFRYGASVDIVRIFADGSTMVRFNETVKIGWGQDIDFIGLLY